MDVSLDDHAPIGPDAGRGSLEAYLGLPALRARFTPPNRPPPDDAALAHALASMTERDEPLRALARAIRILHALLRPDHVRLLGGVGILLEPTLPTLRTLVERDLTRVAKPVWSLSCADDRYLAAVGAAMGAALGAASAASERSAADSA
jgi:predicted NBD/HSP70 family sugar kinase